MADPKPPSDSGGSDPSMDEILASIRRILNEDEPPPAPPAEPPPPPVDNVLMLDPSMMIPEEERPLEKPADPPAQSAVPAEQRGSQTGNGLVAPEVAAAAAQSVGALVRSRIGERPGTLLTRGGPTLEEIVRDEIRPLLKEWLDTNLPPLVERLVRAEIERVVSREVD
jgi:cell pole-organizing protein PopZ